MNTEDEAVGVPAADEAVEETEATETAEVEETETEEVEEDSAEEEPETL